MTMEETVLQKAGVSDSASSKQKVYFEDLGLIDYKSAWDYQEKIFAEIISKKISHRNHPEEEFIPEHHLLFCEHPHVFTLGKSGSMKNLIANQDVLNEKQISFF